MEDVFYGGEIVRAPAQNIEEADNLVHNIIMAQKRIFSAEEYAKKMHQKVDEWLEKAKRDDNTLINTLMPQLIPWAKMEIMDRRKRSVDLLEGRVGFRRKQGKTIDEDKDKTIEWYRQNHPHFVREEVKYKLDVKAAKEFYRLKGEKAPTIDFEDPRDIPYVEEYK